MENIILSDIKIGSLEKSNYIKPLRMKFKQNDKERVWDLMKNHDSVAILIHNVSRDVLVVVKQFRPAVYVNSVETETCGDHLTIDPIKYPASLGVTHELCAGIVDKDMSLEEIAREEILEECGYDVPADSLEKITVFRSSVGVSGAFQTIYYARVTDQMKKSKGGGNVVDGEIIDVVEIPAKSSLEFIMDEHIQKPSGMLFAFHWFHMYKFNKK